MPESHLRPRRRSLVCGRLGRLAVPDPQLMGLRSARSSRGALAGKHAADQPLRTGRRDFGVCRLRDIRLGRLVGRLGDRRATLAQKSRPLDRLSSRRRDRLCRDDRDRFRLASST